MSTVLEYAVDGFGRVSTNGIYHEITLAQWDKAVPVPKRRVSRYGPALEAVAQGKIIALPAPDTKRAHNVQRGVYLAAKYRGQHIETRRTHDPEIQGGQLVLVRAREP